MTTLAHAPHPRSAAALLRGAEAHELAAAVLRRRNPVAAEAHADVATKLRGRAAPGAAAPTTVMETTPVAAGPRARRPVRPAVEDAVARRVAALVDAAPPLTPEQAQRLQVLLGR